MRNQIRLCVVAAAAAVALSACASSGPSPTAPASAIPSPTPTPSSSPTADAGFTLTVLPDEDPVEARVAIPGEKVSFLVTVAPAGANQDPVQISATAVGATVTSVRSAQLKPGVVAEVWLVPDPTETDAVVSTTITASRGSVVQTASRTIKIMPMADERAADARPYFDMWVAWLAANHPELGITATTKWEPTFVSTFLVVSHYAYYSDEWEMKISWHNMIPPYDWSEVYLRHRDTETKPSLDFKIDSVSGKTAPHAETLPDAVMR